MSTVFYVLRISSSIKPKLVAIHHVAVCHDKKSVSVDHRDQGSDYPWEIKLYLDPAATFFRIPPNKSALVLVKIEFDGDSAVNYEAYLLPCTPGQHGPILIEHENGMHIIELNLREGGHEVNCLCLGGEKVCPAGTIPDCSNGDCRLP